MKPNTEMKRVGARSQARMHRNRIFGKRHIVLAMALLASFGASAPAQTGDGTREPYHVMFPVQTRVIADGGGKSSNQYSVIVNGVPSTCPDGSLSGFNIVSFYRKPGTDGQGRPTLVQYDYACIHTDSGLEPVKQYLDKLLDDPIDDYII